MATLGIGFQLSASAAQLAGGINEAVKHFGRLNDAAAETQGYFEALQGVDFLAIAGGVATGNWSVVAGEALEYLDAIGGVERVLGDVQQAAYEAAESVRDIEQRAIAAGVSFQAMQMQDLLDTGTAREDILRLGAAISEVNADRFFELAEAGDKVEESQRRMSTAGESLLRTLVTPFTGLFESFDEGAAAIQNGTADIIGGLNAIADPIASVLSPFLDILGSIGEAALRGAGAILEVTGVILRLGGAIAKVPLELFAEGWRRIAGVIDSVVGSSFDYVESLIDKMQSRIDSFYNFMSQVPVIGGAFASNEGGVSATPDPVAAAAADPAAEAAALEAAKEEEKAIQDVERAIARQETALSRAIDKAREFGEEGFSAALAYQDGLRGLNTQLEAGILNESSYAREAGNLESGFRSQIEAIESRNKEDERAATKRKNEEDRAKRQAQQKAERDSAQAARIDERIDDRAVAIADLEDEQRKSLQGQSSQVLQANDVRSAQGMSQFLALATGREDPAIAEYRKQLQKLDELKNEIRALQQEKATILGGAE